MEHMTLHCPKCGQALTVAVQTAGYATNCRQCGQSLVVPKPPDSGQVLVVPQRPDERKIPLLAMLSVLFSVLVLVPVPVPFAVRVAVVFLALVCAHIARYQIAHDPDSFKGGWATLPGLAVGYGMLAFFALALPEWGRQETSRRIMCAANLKQIGLACSMYADDYAGQFPPDLQTLAVAETERYDEAAKAVSFTFFPGTPLAGKHKYLDTFKLYVCPATETKPATSADELASPKHCDYLYFGRGLVEETVSNPATTVVACDRTGNHKRF